MVLFGETLKIQGVTFLVFSVLAIAAVGYLLGRVTIKGVNLGTAGVFLVAILFGLAHRYSGIINVIFAFLSSLIFSLCYLKTKKTIQNY